MKVTCVGLPPANCLILTLRKINILLDCGQWTVGSERREDGRPMFLGPLGQLLQLHRVEAALITSAECLLALPALLASYPELIQGPIFATVAAVDLAYHHLADMINTDLFSSQGSSYSQHASTSEPKCDSRSGVLAELLLSQLASVRPVPGSTGDLQRQILQRCWLPCPDHHQTQALLSRVKAVHYGQSVSLDGFELTARPYPAGGAFGGALWAISDGSRSIAYLSQFALPPPPSPPGHAPPPVAAALEMEPSTLSHHDALILAPGAVTCSPAAGGGPSGIQPPFSALCSTVVEALRAVGPCLVPLPPSGILWEAIEALSAALAGHPQLAHVPIVYLGTTASAVLGLANTSMEFLSKPRQGRAYIPEPAFPFDALIASGRLVVAPSASDPAVQQLLKQDTQGSTHPVQAVFITSSTALLSPTMQLEPQQQPEARHGSFQSPIHELLTHWSESSCTTLVLCRDVLGIPPGQAAETAAKDGVTSGSSLSCVFDQMYPLLGMRVVEVDIGRVPTLTQLTHLLGGLAQMPGQIVAWEPEAGGLQQWAGAREGRVAVHSYSWLQVVRVKLAPHTLTAMASQAVMQGVAFRHVGGGGSDGPRVLAGKLEAALKFEEGEWRLTAPQPSRQASGLGSLPSSDTGSVLVFGAPSVHSITSALMARGLPCTVHGIEGGIATPGGFIAHTRIRVSSLGAEVLLGDQGAHICAADAATKRLLAACVQGNLPSWAPTQSQASC